MDECRWGITGRIAGHCPCSASSFRFGTWGYPRISVRRWPSCPLPMWLCSSCPEWRKTYIGVDEIAFAVELTLEELTFVEDVVVHLELAVSVVPAFFVLALVFVVEVRGHWYFVKLSNLLIKSRTNRNINHLPKFTMLNTVEFSSKSLPGK